MSFGRVVMKGLQWQSSPQHLALTMPSIYAAFGNKETLFRKALARYTASPAAFVGEAMKEPTAQQSVSKLLMRAVDFLATKARQMIA